MAHPVIFVTGSTDGIGKATATELLSRGAEVIIHGRNAQKGQNVQKELQRTTGREKPDLLVADLSDLDQIQIMAADIISRHNRLDVLINNAGTFEKTRRLTTQGIEMTFAVNYLAPFLLTSLLLPLLLKSAPSRIVTVASSAHEDVRSLHWDNLQGERHYEAWDAYALSKFADITFTYTLARKIHGTGLTANCLHPGIVSTKLLKSAFPDYPGIPVEEGAQTSVYLALDPEVNGVSGKYFEEQKPVRSSALTYDRSVQDRLWNVAETSDSGMRVLD
jgi:NAD(P)-dependent dehydrogenase (short-subunit alcohol dehydrogenase family)